MDLRHHLGAPPKLGALAPTEDGEDHIFAPNQPHDFGPTAQTRPYLLGASPQPGMVRAWALSHWEAKLLDLLVDRPQSLDALVTALSACRPPTRIPAIPPLEQVIESIFHRAARCGWLQAQARPT
jgi:hypothetical protein